MESRIYIFKLNIFLRTNHRRPPTDMYPVGAAGSSIIPRFIGALKLEVGHDKSITRIFQGSFYATKYGALAG